ncbi:trypsin-like serine peptidase [Roseibium sp.]|uniref:trypsin-like serine peptidase n=1 Tax=Roseibium sp. TaxID=1936156 RepID=UPI003A96CB85
MTRLIRAQAAFVIATLSITPSLAAPTRKTETREPKRLQVIDSRDSPWQSIGRVNVAGYRRTFMCTGTLIAPKIVLTAAHCLFNGISGAAFNPKDVIFLAGVRRDQYSARLTADCFKIHEAYSPGKSPELKNLYSDVALIILKEPAELPPVPQMEASLLEPAPRDAVLATAGYHRDRRFLPTFDPKCSIIGDVSGSWITNCASKQGASGGPVFIRNEEKLHVAAVMSATAGNNTSVVVPRAQWQALLQNPVCPPAVDPLLDAIQTGESDQSGGTTVFPETGLVLRPAILPEAQD